MPSRGGGVGRSQLHEIRLAPLPRAAHGVLRLRPEARPARWRDWCVSARNFATLATDSSQPLLSKLLSIVKAFSSEDAYTTGRAQWA